MDYPLDVIIGKLNPACRSSLEQAAALCVSQTHYNVEIEHFLRKLLDRPHTDVHDLLDHHQVHTATLISELTRAMERFRRGNSRVPALSPQLPRLFQEAWLLSSLQLSAPAIRSGAIFAVLLDSEAFRGSLLESAPSLRHVPREGLRRDLREIIRGSEEEGPPGLAAAAAPGGQGPAGSPAKGTQALDLYTIDLTARARAGSLDPILGRDPEIRQIIDILTRRRQNNPILTGEAGVGKTAVVEGFAQRVAKGDVPPALREISVRILDLGLLQAGAGIKGEFENRLKSVIAEVQASPRPIVLFIDEAHTIIGAGGQAGQSDAANLLKPALARGELRTIAATTWSEYKKYFEKDPALTRRFQVVKIDEPDEPAAVAMLRGTVAGLEAHHKVRILDEAVRDAVRLSHRYIAGRLLPDKAISVLDTASARVAIGQTGTPPKIEDAVREIDRLDLELSILEREQRGGGDHKERIAELTAALEAVRARHAGLLDHWEAEKEAVERLRGIEAELQRPDVAPERREELQGERRAQQDALLALQGEEPMIPVCTDSRVVGAVISAWTGIPVGKMLTDEIRQVMQIEQRMSERIVGQPQALDAICRRIRTSRAGLDDPHKPVGVFLLSGPTGVGKTETALVLAECLYGTARNPVIINMSEYQEAHRVSLLKGSPPGYVGYGKGGILTEAVRQNPYTLVLLDEVEKAHPDVLEIFYQVFDKGTLEDGEGVSVDFRNTVLFLTSNVGAEVMNELRDKGERPDPEALSKRLRPALLKHFQPALLGRVVVVPYYPLGDEQIRAIIKLKLQKVQERFRESHRAELTYGEEVVAAVAARCTEVDSGARNVDAILTHTLLPGLSVEVLANMADGKAFTAMHIGLSPDSSGAGAGDFTYTAIFGPPAAAPSTAAQAAETAEAAAAPGDHGEHLAAQADDAPGKKGKRAGKPAHEGRATKAKRRGKAD